MVYNYHEGEASHVNEMRQIRMNFIDEHEEIIFRKTTAQVKTKVVQTLLQTSKTGKPTRLRRDFTRLAGALCHPFNVEIKNSKNTKPKLKHPMPRPI
jgi:hypothetical protein